MDKTKIIVVALLAVLLVILTIVGPLITIWSLNTIFGLQIPYEFKSWAAVIWLMTVFHGIKFQINKS